MRKKYIKLPVFSTGKIMQVEVKKILLRKKSYFQDILIADLKTFGRSLILDGIMQCAEKDHEIYDQEMLKMLKKTDRKILILGGGDGYVAEKALKINPNLKIRLVELDLEVVTNSRQYLGQNIFNNKNVELYIGDALQYMKTLGDGNKFDGIVCDFTGEPITRHKQRRFENFYIQIITLSKKILRKRGWIAVQAGDSKVTKKYINAAKILEKLLKKNFKSIVRSDVSIASYGEDDAFLFGEKR